MNKCSVCQGIIEWWPKLMCVVSELHCTGVYRVYYRYISWVMPRVVAGINCCAVCCIRVYQAKIVLVSCVCVVC